MAEPVVDEWQLAPIAKVHPATAAEADNEPQWEALKERIRTLYLEENRDLEAVRAIVERDHALVGNKYQYEKHFKKWGFRKNLTEHEWAAVGYRLQKRKRDGKDSEVHLDAMILNAKKVRKAVSRYAAASKDILEAASPKLPLDVQICTPSAPLPDLDQTCAALTIVDPTLTALPDVDPTLAAMEGQSPWTMVIDLATAENSIVSTTPSQISRNAQKTLLGQLPFMQFKLLLNTADALPFSKVWSIGPNARKEFDGIQSSLFRQFGDTPCAQMLSPMIKATITDEVWSGDTLSSDESTLPMTKIQDLALFMLSNKITPAGSVVGEKIYSLIKNKNYSEIFSSTELLNSPTIGSLIEELASAAIRNSNVHMLGKILDIGLDPRELKCRNSEDFPETPLQQACSLLCLDMVRLLLDRGADVNYTTEEAFSPLMNAISSDVVPGRTENLIKCTRLLLLAGANVKETYNGPLIEAAIRCEPEVVEMLLLAGADPNGKDDEGKPPLYRAVETWYYGYYPENYGNRTVELLIQAGACVNYQDADRNILSLAICDVAMLQLLLKHGATVTEEDLIEASQSDNLEAIKMMLQFGAKVTPEAFRGIIETLLHEKYLAGKSSDKKPDVIQLLFEALESERKEDSREYIVTAAICFGWPSYLRDLLSEKVVIRDRNALRKALEIRAMQGDASVFHVIFDHDSLHQAEMALCSTSALCRAIEKQHDEITDILLATGTYLTIPHWSTGKSPLFYSIQVGATQLTSLIMSARSVRSDCLSSKLIERCGTFSFECTASVISAAVVRGDITLTRKLLKLHADVNGLEPELGKPALTIAVERQDYEMIDLLIDAGADVNLPVAKFLGLTALAAAVRNNDLVAVHYLLKIGAEIDESSLVNAIGKQPIILRTLIMTALERYKRLPKGFASRSLLLAALRLEISSVKMLLSNGVDPNTITQFDESFNWTHFLSGFPYVPNHSLALITALKYDRDNRFGAVKAFLDAGADPNHAIGKYDEGTALEVAIKKNSTHLVQMLIIAGADVDMRRVGQRWPTPLLFAIEHGNMDVIELLLDCGANVNAPRYDMAEATPLQHASTKGQLGVVRELIKRGADVDAGATEGDGKTAIERAAEHGRIDVLCELVNAGGKLIGSGNDQYLKAREKATENGHLALRRHLDILRDKQQADFDARTMLAIWNKVLLD